jgi:hypothetical protein
MVVDLFSHQVARAADWYVHDEGRYFWPLGHGHFLLRRLNSLYVVDSELKERLLLNSPRDLLWTSVTPDGKQILLETPIDSPPAPANSSPVQPNRARRKIEFVDAESLAIRNTLQATGAVELEAASSGYADSTRSVSGKVWLVRFGGRTEERRSLARVKSPCKPDLLFPSNETLFDWPVLAEGRL